ncbi:MAG: hypothetical protein ACI87W_000986 [Halieaceae bacterium]|jgi:hypothetical protein
MAWHGMAWHGAFIFLMSVVYTDYYYKEVYFLRDELEGSSGYIFLALMVFTSFWFSRRHLSQKQWKFLHRSGVYFLWTYPFSVYWWNIFYYRTGEFIDYVFYWASFLAVAARIAPWGMRSRQSAREYGPASQTPLPLRVLGLSLLLAGSLASATGHLWQEPASAYLLASDWSARLELWLPFWPFQPFLSLLTLWAGIFLMSEGLSQTIIDPGRVNSTT